MNNWLGVTKLVSNQAEIQTRLNLPNGIHYLLKPSLPTIFLSHLMATLCAELPRVTFVTLQTQSIKEAFCPKSDQFSLLLLLLPSSLACLISRLLSVLPLPHVRPPVRPQHSSQTDPSTMLVRGRGLMQQGSHLQGFPGPRFCLPPGLAITGRWVSESVGWELSVCFSTSHNPDK